MANAALFTEREQDVIALLLEGRSNKQIALALGITNRTVEYHLKNIYLKQLYRDELQPTPFPIIPAGQEQAA